MTSGLRARLAADGAGATAPPVAAAPLAAAPPAVVESPAPPQLPADKSLQGEILESIAAIDVEAVVGGVLQRISFIGGTNPAEVGAILRLLDPNVKTRDAFPSKFGGGGGRETKLARCVNILLKISPNSKFIDLICQNGEDLTVGVSKKNSDTWLGSLKALGKLHDRSIAKAEKAFAENSSATLILAPDEIFGVHYWKTDDGKAFLENMVAEAPAPEGGAHV